MRNILILFLAICSFSAFSQTALLNLGTESSPQGGYFVPIGATGRTVYKKITVTKLNSLEKAERVGVDTTIKNGAGLNSSFNYVAKTNTHYLTPTLFIAKSLTQNLYNADKLLDSAIYNLATKTALLDTGSTNTGTVRYGLNNTAVGAGSIALNTNNNAHAINTFAHGYNSVAQRPYSDVISSGKFTIAGDAQGMNYVMYGTTREAVPCTLKIALSTYPILTTDQLSKFLFDVVAVSDSGKVGTLGRGFSQLWQVTAVNNAGTSALIGVADSASGKRTAGWIPYVTTQIDDATESVWVIVHGVADYRIRWVAYMRETSVGFRNFTLGY